MAGLPQPGPGRGPGGRLERWLARYGLRPGLVITGSLVAILVGIVAGWAWDALQGPGEPPATGPQSTLVSGPPLAPPPIKTPVYEEPVPQPPPGAVMQKIDETVFAVLHRQGIPDQEIQVSVVNSPQSELTRVQVRLPKGLPPENLAAALGTGLAELAQTRLASLTDGLRLEVLLASRPTHHIDLLISSLQPKPPPRQLPARPQVALIIDDLGYLMDPARQLVSLDLPLTLSILPHSPYGPQIEQMAAKRGLEVLVHLPMEPRTFPGLKPGPGALLTAMSPAKLSAQTERNLASVPSARGANNHMGSRFTERAEALNPVMAVLKRKGFFFVDSVTSPRSQAMRVARKQGVPTSRRHVFLDHDLSRQAIEAQLKRALSLAHKKGRVIVIGHPHRTTLSVLKQYAKRLRTEVELVPVSVILGVKAARSHTPAAALDTSKAKP